MFTSFCIRLNRFG